MKKKIILLVVLIIVILIIIGIIINNKNDNKNNSKESLLFEHDNYKNLKLEDIKSISVLTYTEGGLIEEEYTDSNYIKTQYDYFKKLKLTKETNSSCDDNTIVYVFNLVNNKKKKIEIECDWIVLNNKHYYYR